jgi:hypothetical protein
MKLHGVNITRKDYGQDKGQYEGKMTFKTSEVSVDVTLNHAVCIEVLLAAQAEIKLLAAQRCNQVLHDIATTLEPMAIDAKDDEE